MSHRSFLDAAELPDNEGHDEDAWHDLVRMPDDDTQTLAGVLEVMRDNNLQRQAAFVRWLAEDWYEAKAKEQSAQMDASERDRLREVLRQIAALPEPLNNKNSALTQCDYLKRLATETLDAA